MWGGCHTRKNTTMRTLRTALSIWTNLRETEELERPCQRRAAGGNIVGARHMHKLK